MKQTSLAGSDTVSLGVLRVYLDTAAISALPAKGLRGF